MHLTIVPDVVRNQEIVELPAGAMALQAAQVMVDRDTAAVVILDASQRLIGIVTERDLTRRVLAPGRDPASTPLEAIMTRNPDTLSPQDSALDALELMSVRRYRHLPVVDNGKVVGMVSIRDLYAAVKVKLEEDIREAEAFAFGDR